jgi:hypothetical protein
VQPRENYFQYGLVQWTLGANAGLEAEIKSSTTTDDGTEIELQIGMGSNIADADAGDFIMGYDGSREAARALGEEAVEGLQSEPDLPPSAFILNYPDA